jgi:tyrosine-protein phosphatase non-receptor type 1
MSQDTEVRKRITGGGLQGTQAAFPTKGEPSPPKEEEEQGPTPTPWKPFLVNVCMATVLTAGAYLCYRVCFH